MARRGGGSGRRPWPDKTIKSDISPGRRALAEALQSLARLLRSEERSQDKGVYTRPTQEEAAGRIKTSSTSLSRFLSGHYVPDVSVVRNLHAAAVDDTDGLVGISFGELEVMRETAEAERRCHRCANLADEAASLSTEAESLRRQLKVLENDRAGLQARLATLTRATQLPVPRRRGDRQLMSRDKTAARQVAEQAQDLQRQGSHDSEAVLILLRQTAMEVLSPAETAITLGVLRELDQHHLADNLIHVYARDQPDQSVMNVALALHELGLPDDAGAILRAAVG
ncbi:hypothetical protein ABZ078_11090 [Streptomyces sp. NPDC006385]|uniref:hypothetical protein n=1 Tax=Streptomyces sp. NPDC006385 TaxID=3156761 RepID=UPI0033B489E6